jgi:hypothetical protein
MLTEAERKELETKLDSIIKSVLQLREDRGYMPPRDEDKIAEILQRWDNSAAEEHRRLIESEEQFAVPVKKQLAARLSENLRKVPQIQL